MPDRVRIDPYTRQAWVGERLLELAPRHWRLLAALVAQPGRAMSWPALAAAACCTVRGVRLSAFQLRRLLGDAAYVEVLYGFGLRFPADLAEDIYVGVEVHSGR